MERLQILTAGAQRVFKPSLRNLPARLSTPVALLVLNSFIFRISTELTFSNLSFFFMKVNSLVSLAHWRYSKFARYFLLLCIVSRPYLT